MRKNKSKKTHSFLLFFPLMLFAAGLLFFCHTFSAAPLNAMEHNQFSSAKKKDSTEQQEQKKILLNGRQQKKCRKIYRKNQHVLVLVNRKTPLSESYEPNLQAVSNGRLMASSLIYSDLKEMLSDAGNLGYQYWLASAWRSRERQQQLVDEDIQVLINKGMSYAEAEKEVYKETQPAGHSEHETGLALDILCSHNPEMTLVQEQEPGNQWLQENSWKYGFILRYPKDKEELTEISYEPWHFRYVGKKAAKFMHRNNLCLEEFYQIAVN